MSGKIILTDKLTCAEVGGENILTEILTAEVVGNANIYDRAIIRRVGDLAQIQLKILQWVDKFSGK